jgi:hypothetical protein
MTSFIAAGGSGRSTSLIPAVPAAWSVTTIAFMGIVSSVICLFGGNVAAERAGLSDLAGEHVRPVGRCGVNAAVKVAGMAGGADSIDDLDLLRHGAMPALFGEVRAPSTLGSFLRAFTWGNVLQLGKASRRLLAELTRRAPLLPGKDTLAFIDIDSQQKRVYGRKKQGVAAAPSEIRVAVDLRSMTDNHADNTDLHPDRELRLRPGPRACVTPPGPASSTETGHPKSSSC